MPSNIDLRQAHIAEFCRRHRIRRLALFGSALRDDFAQTSDLDFLVTFEPGTRVGLITLAGMEIELGRLLGHRVELHTPGGLNPQFRDEVLHTAEVQYEQT